MQFELHRNEFQTDDIMLTMAKSMKNYFKLNKENANQRSS